MSGPKIQFQLFGRPPHLAGCGRSLRQRRTIAMACRPVASPALSDPLDVLQPRSVGGDLFQDQSSPVECVPLSSCHHGFLPPGVENHSTPMGSADVQNLFAGSANGHG